MQDYNPTFARRPAEEIGHNLEDHYRKHFNNPSVTAGEEDYHICCAKNQSKAGGVWKGYRKLTGL